VIREFAGEDTRHYTRRGGLNFSTAQRLNFQRKRNKYFGVLVCQFPISALGFPQPLNCLNAQRLNFQRKRNKCFGVSVSALSFPSLLNCLNAQRLNSLPVSVSDLRFGFPSTSQLPQRSTSQLSQYQLSVFRFPLWVSPKLLNRSTSQHLDP
jgi:hypothetical protein